MTTHYTPPAIHTRRYGPLQRLGCGRHRETYASICGRFVYKVPLQGGANVGANATEAGISPKYGFRQGPLGERPARCRVLSNGVLVMERLVRFDAIGGNDPHQWENEGFDEPQWCRGLRDGAYQWGYTRDGRFVVYDYTEESHIFRGPDVPRTQW